MTNPLIYSLFKQPLTFASRIWGKKQKRSRKDDEDATAKRMINTEHVPPVSSLAPSLKPVVLPRICPPDQLTLAYQGWTKITYDSVDALQIASDALFLASRKFFDLPAPEKRKFRTRAGTEEGWSRVEGEKEFISIRTLSNTPLELREAVSKFWAEAGTLLNSIVSGIETSLELPPGSLSVFSKPCMELSDEKIATMLRLFRYESFEGEAPRIVAEGMLCLILNKSNVSRCISPSFAFSAESVSSVTLTTSSTVAHRDLGMLSLVIGDSPGLEVWDRQRRQWFPLERNYPSPAASLFVGRQLERLTNGCYYSGGHLVNSYPDVGNSNSSNPSKRYRHSIVFVLRAHSPVPIKTDDLETSVTGKFAKPLQNITADDLFKTIRSTHFNINAGVEERDGQKRKLAASKTT